MREDIFRRIVDSIPGLVSTMTATGEVEFVNRQNREYCGVPLEELRNWSANDLVHADDLPAVLDAWRHSVETGEMYEVEHRIRRADGEYLWFQVRGVPERDTTGGIVRWYVLLTNIDERKRAEEALRSSEQSFRLIVDSIPGLVSTRTASGLPEFINRQTLEFFGEALKDLTDWSPLLHEDDRSRIVNLWRGSLERGEPFESEFRARRADGVYRWLHSRVYPLRDDQGTVLRWYNLLTDIDDRKLAEEALRASERDLSLIIETMPGLVWCASPEGELTYMNQRILTFLGASREELEAGGWADFLHCDDRDAVARTWSSCVATGSPFEVQARLRRADGVYRWVYSVGQPGRDSQARVTCWYGLLVDIDDRKNMEEALRTTEAKLSRATQTATVGELAASIAHEVNQPLAAVVANGHACLRWLSAVPPNLEKAQEAAERVVRDGREAGEVVRRIRALFKRAPAETVALDLNGVIGEVLRLVQNETIGKAVSVETDLGKIPSVAGDRVQLQQLVLNLVVNALDAMEPVPDRERRLVIRSTQHDGENVLVEVQDSGIGLKDVHGCFDAFFTTKESGMGIGLSICRSIVEAHNGRIWAKSGEAQGATFLFTLPLSVNALP